MHPNRVAAIALAVLVTAGCGGPTAPTPLPTPAAPTPTPTPLPTPTPDPTVPILIAPAEGVTLDNGCTFPENDMTWEFEWSAVPGASRYHIRVESPGAAFPYIDEATTATTYRKSTVGYTGRTGWQWKVQAELNGAFGPYSPVRTFTVERVNTDCP